MAADAGAGAVAAPRLSVVIPAVGRPGADAAALSVLASAATAGVATQVILAWQSPDPPPDLPPGVELLRAFPAGASYARNRGIDTARADLVAFVDDDEQATPTWASAVLAAFAEGADAAVGPIAPASADGFAHCHFEGMELRWFHGTQTPPWTIGSGGNLAVRRTLLQALGGFDLRLGGGSVGQTAEDTDLLMRLLAAGARIRWRPDMRVLHPTKTAAERLASRRRYGFGIGSMVRRRRAPAVAGRYGVAMFWAARTALRQREPRLARELAAMATGFAAGALTRDLWRSPDRLRARVPPRIRQAIGGRRIEAWPVPHRGAPHFLWGVGEELVLHAYADVPVGWTPGADARRAAAAASLPGVPRIVATASDADACWVVEQRLPGRTPHRMHEWWTGAADWAMALAGTGAAPLRESPWWRAWRARADRPALAAALEALADRPAIVVHGDLQAKNVLVASDGALGVLDWEQATAAGPPGLDLLYLAVAAHPAPQRADAVRRLAAGRDPDGTPVLERLRRVGLHGADVGAALCIAVHAWAADEAVRQRRLGVPPQLPVFAPLVQVADA